MDDRNCYGQTPLHARAQEGSRAVVRLYIKMGADITAQDNQGRTPLHIAARNGHAPTVKALLFEQEEDDCLEVIDVNGLTALQWAAKKKGNENIVRLLLDAGAKFDRYRRMKVAQATTFLEWGVKNDHYKMVQSLLDQVAVGGPDYGKRMLELAVENRSTRTLWVLLERSLLEAQQPNACRSLMPLTEEGTAQAFLGLLRRGEDANAKDMGKTRLSMAAESKFWSSVHKIVGDSAEVNIRVNGEVFLLLILDEYRWIRKNMGVCYCGKIYCGHDPNGHVGILERLTKIAHLLVPHMGETINEANRDGKTALHLAAEGSLWEIVKALVRYNANTTRTESERLYPRDLVRDEDKKEYDEWFQLGHDQREWRKQNLHREQ